MAGGHNTSGFRPGSGISASNPRVLSCGKEGFHLFLVAGSAEIWTIIQTSLGQAVQGLCPVLASKEFFELFREKPPLISQYKNFPLCISPPLCEVEREQRSVFTYAVLAY